MRNVWRIREDVLIGLTNERGLMISYDFSLDIKEWDNYRSWVVKTAGDIAYVGTLGHIGDGNIHFFISCKPKDCNTIHKRLEPGIITYLEPFKGSVSAEHGLGFMKRNYLH